MAFKDGQHYIADDIQIRIITCYTFMCERRTDMKRPQFIIQIALILFSFALFGCKTTGVIFDSNPGEGRLTFVMKDGHHLNGLVKKPAGTGPFPTVIFLHGSGGMGYLYQKLVDHLTNDGFVGVAYARRGFPYGGGLGDRRIRYRDYIFKDVSDLNTVMNQLREYSFIGRAPIGIIGMSEGGHVAYLAASQIHELKAVVGLSGATDYLDLYNWALTEYPKYPLDKYKNFAKSVSKIFGCNPEQCRDRYIALSPIHQIKTISCPIMIVHGEKDPQVPVRQAYLFADALKAAGKTYIINTYQNQGHFPAFFSNPKFGDYPGYKWFESQVWSKENSQDALAKIDVFFAKYLK